MKKNPENPPLLAIEGGKPTIETPVPQPERWGNPERELLTEMPEQKSLFYWNGPHCWNASARTTR